MRAFRNYIIRTLYEVLKKLGSSETANRPESENIFRIMENLYRTLLHLHLSCNVLIIVTNCDTKISKNPTSLALHIKYDIVSESSHKRL